MARWWSGAIAKLRALNKWYILLPIALVMLSPFIIFAALLIEARLTVYNYTRFEGSHISELIQSKGPTSAIFEGEDFAQELQDHLKEDCCSPPRNIRGIKAYVYRMPVRFAWANAVFYVDSKGKIVGVEISGT